VSGLSWTVWKHIGLYGFRRDFLLTFAALPRTPLEQAESLEQLRALEHGYRIRTVATRYESIEVDTPEDLERVRQLMATRV
jgi:3-deoxy-manno-octulosonate cytidylyltransferase (CMP-KDO synthetase)